MNACKTLKALSEDSDILWNYSIYQINKVSTLFGEWIEMFELTAFLSEKRMWVSDIRRYEINALSKEGDFLWNYSIY